MSIATVLWPLAIGPKFHWSGYILMKYVSIPMQLILFHKYNPQAQPQLNIPNVTVLNIFLTFFSLIFKISYFARPKMLKY